MKTPYFHAVAALATMAGITFAAEGSSAPTPSADPPADPETVVRETGTDISAGHAITRAEAVRIAVLVRRGMPQGCTGKAFSDVTTEIGEELCAYVEAGARLGIVSAARKFRPLDPVSPKEMEKMFLTK